jgi:hypothetical protein
MPKPTHETSQEEMPTSPMAQLVFCLEEIQQSYTRMYRLWYAGAFFMAMVPFMRSNFMGGNWVIYECMIVLMAVLVFQHNRKKHIAMETLLSVLAHNPENIVSVKFRPWIYKDCLFTLRDDAHLSVYLHILKLKDLKQHIQSVLPWVEIL